jgi:hypothetical protein
MAVPMAPFAALPAELLEEVARNLPIPDLLSLRLTCFTVARKIEHHFTRVCYAEKGFLLDSPGSIKIALDCARHPTVGPAMRHIVFFIDKIANPEIDTEPNHISSQEHLALLRWMRHRLWEDYQLYTDARAQRTALVELFEELRKHGKLATVSFTSTSHTQIVPAIDKGALHASLRDLKGVIRDILLEPSPADPSVELVLQAIALSGIMSIQQLGLYVVRPLYLDAIPAANFGMHGGPLGTIKSLTVLVPHPFGWQNGATGLLYMDAFSRSITAWPFLQSLSIHMKQHQKVADCCCIVDSDVFVALTQVFLPSLAALELTAFDLSFYTLLDFIRCHQALKKLTLRGTWINCSTILPYAQHRESIAQILGRLTALKEVDTDKEGTEAALALHWR